MSTLSYLGAGLSYRWDLNPLIMKHRDRIDWLELTPEHFLPLNDDAAMRLSLLARRFPIVGHSLELSVGSDGVDEPGYREGVKRFLELTRAGWHGDHLCFTRAGEVPIHALTPVPFIPEAAEVAARNIRAVGAELETPFIVENIAYYFQYPGQVMDEADFVSRVLQDADCGWLLDLHNLYTNAVNFGFDPYAYLERMPLDRVVQIHLAGGDRIDGLWLDTHASCTPDEVWALLDFVVPRCPVRGVNFEMDSRFPPFERILEELDHARAILKRHGAEGSHV